MELIRINARKLKIMLTPTDMCHFELDAESFGEDSTKMHRAFRLLFDEIKHQIDFDADDNRISVQYFPSKEGGCELFVTKIGLLLDQEKEGVRSVQKGKSGAPRQRRESALTYRFEDFSLLLAACRRLQAISLRTSSVFRDEKGAWWLFLSGCEPQKLRFLSSYAREVRTDFAHLYLDEYGNAVCEKNAVETLAKL